MFFSNTRTAGRPLPPVYTELRSAHQNLRLRSAFQLRHHSSVRSELSSKPANLQTFKHALDRHGEETPYRNSFSSCRLQMPPPSTSFLAHPYKCPGVWGSTLPFLNSYLNSFCSQRPFPCKNHFATPLFSIRCALFQVPYLVSPLLACPPWRVTLTKTAGCISTFPSLDLCPSPPSPSPEVPLRA